MAMPNAISQLCWMFFLKIIDDQDQQLELMQDGYHSQFRQNSAGGAGQLTQRASQAKNS